MCNLFKHIKSKSVRGHEQFFSPKRQSIRTYLNNLSLKHNDIRGVNMPASINLMSYFIEMACAIEGILN